MVLECSGASRFIRIEHCRACRIGNLIAKERSGFSIAIFLSWQSSTRVHNNQAGEIECLRVLKKQSSTMHLVTIIILFINIIIISSSDIISWFISWLSLELDSVVLLALRIMLAIDIWFPNCTSRKTGNFFCKLFARIFSEGLDFDFLSLQSFGDCLWYEPCGKSS